MKAILEFNLPEDKQEHLQAVNSNLAWSALDEIKNHVRSHLKHGLELKLELINNIINSAQTKVDLE
jgi:hypothetical protein